MMSKHRIAICLIGLLHLLDCYGVIKEASEEEISNNTHCDIEYDDKTYVLTSENDLSLSPTFVENLGGEGAGEPFPRSGYEPLIVNGEIQCDRIGSFLWANYESLFYDEYDNYASDYFEDHFNFVAKHLGCKKVNFLLDHPHYQINVPLSVVQKEKVHFCGIYREEGELVNPVISSGSNIDAMYFKDTDFTLTHVDVVASSLNEGRALITMESNDFGGAYELKIKKSTIAVQSGGGRGEGIAGDTLRLNGYYLRGDNHVLENHGGGAALKLDGFYSVNTRQSLFNLSGMSVGIRDHGPGTLTMADAFVQSALDGEPSRFYVQEDPSFPPPFRDSMLMDAYSNPIIMAALKAQYGKHKAMSFWNDVCVSGSWSPLFTFNQNEAPLYQTSESGNVYWLSSSMGQTTIPADVPDLFSEGGSGGGSGENPTNILTSMFSGDCPFAVTQTRVVGPIMAETETTAATTETTTRAALGELQSTTNSGSKLTAFWPYSLLMVTVSRLINTVLQ